MVGEFRVLIARRSAAPRSRGEADRGGLVENRSHRSFASPPLIHARPLIIATGGQHMRSFIASAAAMTLIGLSGTAAAQASSDARATQRRIPPVAISVGQTVSGTLTDTDARAASGSYFDCYAISGPPGTVISITMQSEDFDTNLEGDNLTCEAERGFRAGDDDSGDGTNSRAVFTLGDQPVLFRAWSVGRPFTGAYSLSVTAIDGAR
jgi:hypothetical protein